MADYVANGPVSQPINYELESHVDLGGFAWNNEQGFFLPVVDELESWDIPYPAPDRGSAT